MDLPPIEPRIQTDFPTIPTFKEFLTQTKEKRPLSPVFYVSVVLFCVTAAVIYVFIANWMSVKRISVRTGLSSTGGHFPTLTNTGVLSLTPGTGITLSGTSHDPIVSNAGVLTVDAGTGCSNAGTAQNRVINCSPTGKVYSTYSISPSGNPLTVTCHPKTLSEISDLNSDKGDICYSQVINANFGGGQQYLAFAFCNATMSYTTASSITGGDQVIFKAVISNMTPQHAYDPDNQVELMFPLSSPTTPSSSTAKVDLHANYLTHDIYFNGAQTLYVTVYACYISSGASPIDIVLTIKRRDAQVMPAYFN